MVIYIILDGAIWIEPNILKITILKCFTMSQKVKSIILPQPHLFLQFDSKQWYSPLRQ